MTLQRKEPMRRSATRLARTAIKRKREKPEEQQFRQWVRDRARGLCERRTPACPAGVHRGETAHHIVTRARGRGWSGLHDPANGVYLCHAAHTWVHANIAAATGLDLLRSAPQPRRGAVPFPRNESPADNPKHGRE